METGAGFTLRLATEEDIPALDRLIEASVRGLQAGEYTPAQIDGALGTVLGIDTQLIADRTYFVAEAVGGGEEHASVAEQAAEKQAVPAIFERSVTGHDVARPDQSPADSSNSAPRRWSFITRHWSRSKKR